MYISAAIMRVIFFCFCPKTHIANVFLLNHKRSAVSNIESLPYLFSSLLLPHFSLHCIRLHEHYSCGGVRTVPQPSKRFS